jgi:hypothetical protein
MFCGKKQDIEKVIEFIRKDICCYMGNHCDCKYGYNGKKDYGSEQTGCPELRTILELLKNMSEYEYNEILSRSNNILL